MSQVTTGTSISSSEAFLQWDEEKCRKKACILIPKFLRTVESEDSVEDVVQTSKLLATKFLPFVHSEQLGREILSTVYPRLSSAFDCALSSLPGKNTRSSDFKAADLVPHLQNAIKILQCLEVIKRTLISAISKSEKASVPLEAIPTVPNSTISILKNSYMHCKNSEECYGDLFRSASNALSILFQKTFSLQKALTVVLTKLEPPQIEQGSEAEENTHCPVVEICEGLTEIGSVINGLDHTLLGATWKLLLGFMSKFKPLLKDKISVASYVKVLCEHVSNCLKYTIELSSNSAHLLVTEDTSTKKAFLRSCKLSQFFASSLVLFLRDFSDILCSTSCSTIAAYTSDFYNMMKPGLQSSGNDGSALEAQFFTSIVSEFRKILLECVQAPIFLQILLREKDEVSHSKPFGLLMLLLSVCGIVLKNESGLIVSDSDESTTSQALWTCIIEASLKAHDDLPLPLSSCDENQPKKVLTLYETVTVHCCGLMSSFPESVFHTCEKILVDNLLSFDPLRSSLAVDILVFICRSSPALCSCYFKTFLDIFQAVPKPLEHFPLPLSVDQILSLLKRILPLLCPSEQRKFFFDSCKDNMQLAVHFLSVIDCDEEMKQEHKHMFLSSSKELCQNIKVWINGGRKLKDLHKLSLDMMICEKLLYKMNESGLNNIGSKQEMELLGVEISKFWDHISVCSTLDMSSSVLLCRLLVSLVAATSHLAQAKVKSLDIEKVLHSFSRFAERKHCPTAAKICIAGSLFKFGYVNLPEETEVELSKIFTCLLCDASWRVQHAALNSFEIVSRTSSGTLLLERCASSQVLAAKIESHLCRTSRILPEKISLNSDLRNSFLNSADEDPYQAWLASKSESVPCLSKVAKSSENHENTRSTKLVCAANFEKVVLSLRTATEEIKRLAQGRSDIIGSFSKDSINAMKEARTVLDSVIKRSEE